MSIQNRDAKGTVLFSKMPMIDRIKALFRRVGKEKESSLAAFRRHECDIPASAAPNGSHKMGRQVGALLMQRNRVLSRGLNARDAVEKAHTPSNLG